ncbi:MAG: type II 3-dehydroquinate dehydratase [Proteobacteria bacterium]|nr:type II 3-dehydroquinate dehydratase [Pseudomonadota bacterium]NCA28434.1 type II 3-dehydroquinate dehydratase [Pseudomonadota bacterium]
MKKILIINGPNLNLLHLRNKVVYGSEGLDKISNDCQEVAKQIGVEINFVQSNHEGEIIELVQNAINNFDGIIINGAGFTHTSVAIRDALEIFQGPKIELHISNIFKREDFRHHSFFSAVVDGVISGLGSNGYTIALLAIHNLIK